MNTILDCDPTKPYIPDVYQYDMSPPLEEENSMMKCYKIFKEDNDPRVYVKGCHDYCKIFSITNAKEIIEGHFGKLLYLFNKIKSKEEIQI